MPIPDKTIFGPHLSEKRGIAFGEVRQITDPDIKLQYLKIRLEGFLTTQIDNIEKIYAPFPMVVMTCIAVETLGRVIEPVNKYENDPKKKKEISKIVSVRAYGLLDKKLTRSLTKEFKKTMQANWPHDDIKGITSYAEMFHSYLRTSFMHGYRAKNVFISHKAESWVIENGFLIINPNWFWKSYKIAFEESFEKIFDKKELNNPYRQNALDFFDRLINE